MTRPYSNSSNSPPEATRPTCLGVRSFGLTDPGKVRPSNEDNFLIAELARTLRVQQCSLPQPQTRYGRHRGHLFLVADGMGGHQAGEVASAMTVEAVEAFILNILQRFSNLRPTDERAVLQDLQAAIHQADAHLFEEATNHPELLGMGTTLTMAFISGRTLFVIHAGDSRCYLARAGKIRPLTIDHTWAAELARSGLITPEEARTHRWRHVVNNILGGNVIGVRVDVQQEQLEPGDALLLCSDGLTDMLTDDRIAEILAAEQDPEAACRRLVDAANEQGGRDNITCVVARMEGISRSGIPMPRR